MGFDEEKARTLRRMREHDRSDKGSIDEPISTLLKQINARDEYYTTSSCAGRIIVLAIAPSRRKDEAQFLLREHRKVTAQEVVEAIEGYSGTGELWLRTEGAILHICARDVDVAMRMVELLRPIGFKRCGVFSIKPERVLIEAIAPDQLCTPVHDGDGWLIDPSSIAALIERANDLLQRTHARIEQARCALAHLGGAGGSS